MYYFAFSEAKEQGQVQDSGLTETIKSHFKTERAQVRK